MSIAVEISTATHQGKPVVVFNLGECTMLLSPEDARDIGQVLVQAANVISINEETEGQSVQVESQ